MQQTISYIQGLVDQVEDNLSEEINVIQLADSFNMSPWHFQRTFKAFAGDTLGGYIRGRRLTEAARLLLNSDLGIIDIAFRVGFNSHEAFTRSFKAYFGQSPKNFRKNLTTVALKEKPLLTMDLIEHLQKEIDREPIIKTSQRQVVIGIETPIPSPFNTEVAYCETLWPAWEKLLEREQEINDRPPTAFYGITVSPSGTFTEDELIFIAGVPTVSENVPENMVAHIFPQQQVAMFRVATIDKETVLRTIDYIYGYWLPNSQYTRGSGSDYELFEESNGFIDPGQGSHYVIPVVLK